MVSNNINILSINKQRQPKKSRKKNLSIFSLNSFTYFNQFFSVILLKLKKKERMNKYRFWFTHEFLEEYTRQGVVQIEARKEC